MKISQLFAAGALAVGLALVGCGAGPKDACENLNEVCDQDTDCDKAEEAADEFECSEEPDYGCMADAEKCEDAAKCDLGKCEPK